MRTSLNSFSAIPFSLFYIRRSLEEIVQDSSAQLTSPKTFRSYQPDQRSQNFWSRKSIFFCVDFSQDKKVYREAFNSEGKNEKMIRMTV